LAIVTWLEKESNFNLITGKAPQNRNVVAGKKLKKSDAYTDLANYINTAFKGEQWTKEIAKSRYNAYLKYFIY
jgi:hypothetical protein